MSGSNVPNRKKSWEGSGALNVTRVNEGFLALTSYLIVSSAVHYVVGFVVLPGGRNMEETYQHLKQNQKSLFSGKLKLDLSHRIVKLLRLLRAQYTYSHPISLSNTKGERHSQKARFGKS